MARMNRTTPSVANGCLEPLWPLTDEDVGVGDDHRSAGIFGGEQSIQLSSGETALARLGLELVHGSRDLAVLRGDQIAVERHRQEDAEIALVALDDHRLLDAVVEELPEILTGFGSGHGFIRGRLRQIAQNVKSPQNYGGVVILRRKITEVIYTVSPKSAV